MATDVIIVGAGLSGLVAANQLKQAGKVVTLLDKGRSVGGRLATRRIGNGLADHGAQFFTVRTEEFQQQVDQWLSDELVTIWGHGWSDGSVKKTGVNDGHPRYVCLEGMNALAKNIAKPLNNIHVSTKVTNVSWNSGLWQVRDTENHFYESTILIMTPPVPQTLDLIKGVPLTESEKQELERIQYGPCLCGLFIVEGDVDLPDPGAIQNFENTVYWVADNQRKGISPDEHIITTHAEARYSRTHYDDPDEENLAFLRQDLKQYLADGAIIKEAQLKKWRYSVPLTTHPHDFMKAQDLPLIFAGDAFGGRGRIEGAYLSGLAAGNAAIEHLNQD